MQTKVLAVDDDTAILAMLKRYFAWRLPEFRLLTADAGQAALSQLAQQPDLILLDVNLPDIDGFTLTSRIRAITSVPIIFLTARITDQDKVRGLGAGGDDYVTKPFTPLELMARVNSQLRRYTQFANRSPKEEKNDRIHVIGGLELNEDTVEVFVDGKPVKMTPIEFKILALLIRTPGRVYSADEIYERVWNEKAINTDTIMVHVRNIRDKIEINPKDPKYLKVVWGVGYKIEKQQ